MNQPSLIAKAALINDAGQILILTRSATAPNRPNEADLPGGKVEAGEDYQTAVRREIEEEIGISLDADAVSLVYAHTDHYDDLTTIRFLFAGQFPAGKTPVLSHEHSAWQWMTLAEAEESYNHNVWVEGISFASRHGLLPVALS